MSRYVLEPGIWAAVPPMRIGKRILFYWWVLPLPFTIKLAFMKKLLFLLLIALPVHALFAQTKEAKNDVILKMNGDEMVGKVTEMNNEDVKFVYEGETLTYTIPKKDILRITFASGRIEVINKPALASEKANESAEAMDGPHDSHNKVAVLPFGLLVDNQGGADEFALEIQNECYNLMSKKTATLKYQDPNTTNAILFKHNIDRNTIRGFTTEELCHILDVEYIIMGTVKLNRTTMTSSTSKNTNTTYKSPTSDSKSNSNNKSTAKTNTSTYSSSQQNYSTSITLNVFDEHGTKVFGKDHTSVWPSQDAYKITLAFLAKRTPIYGR